MNTNEQIKSAVANIQDELSRIVTVAGLFELGSEGDTGAFRKKLIAEFNGKLRSFRMKNQALQEENRKLRARIAILEKKSGTHEHVKAPEPPELSHTSNESRMPPPKRRLASEEDKVEILSSPLKQQAMESPATRQTATDLTSSQFNKLPTQYSDASSEPPSKRHHGEDEESVQNDRRDKNSDHVINDLQDEFEELSVKKSVVSPRKQNFVDSGRYLECGPEYPLHYTALQRIEFLRAYYELKLQDRQFQLEMSTNPITEKTWALYDFVPNTEWKPPKKLNDRLGVMTKAQEKTYDNFFNQAGYGRKTSGPVWSQEHEEESSENSWTRSQVMDKYLSPPGYMVGDFVSTQEAQEARKATRERQQERIRRRMRSALQGGEFLFYEPLFNQVARLGKYVNGTPVF